MTASTSNSVEGSAGAGGVVSVDEFRAEARAWLAANLARRSDGSDGPNNSEDKTPEEIAASRLLQRTLYDGGFAGITYPTEYGGRGLTPAHEDAFREEARPYVVPEFGGAGMVMFTAIGKSLLAHGSPALRARYVPKLLAGEELWCQFYSEPEAGSDLAGIRTRATKDGDHWVIRGSKIWSTGAHHADFAMCLARTDWDVPKHRGLTWFVVPTAAPGVTVRPIRQINGDTGFCEAFLDDVVVDDAAIIGELNHGWSVTQTMLVYERQSGSGSIEPLALAPDLVALARRVGRLDDPIVQQAIAKAHVLDFARHHLRNRVMTKLQRARDPQPAIASYVKLATGVYTPMRVRIAVEIGGAEALAWDGDQAAAPKVALDYLNGRMTSIAAGTNEMQRNGIGERILGLPREPSFDSSKPFSDVLRNARNWDGKVG